MTIQIAQNVAESVRDWISQQKPTDPSNPYAQAMHQTLGTPMTNADWNPDFMPETRAPVQRVLTLEQARAIISNVRFNDWTFTLTEIGERAGFYLQISADETNNVTGEPMRWKSRKWLVSPYSTNSELVLSCWKAVQTAREHEDREQFLYKGAAILGPHHDVDDLAARLPRQDLRARMTPKGQI